MKRATIIYIFFLLYPNFLLIIIDEINDIRKRIQTQIRKINSSDNLKSLLSNGGIFDCDNTYCSHLSLLNSQYISDQIQEFPQIYPINLNDNNKVIVIIFKKHLFPEDSNNYISGVYSISDIVYFNLYNFENDIINTDPFSLISSGHNNILVYLPIYVSDTLKNKILSVSGQNPSTDLIDLKNYDIFNPNAKIYKDICTTISYSIFPEDVYSQESIKNHDITLEQRKKYYFPGNMQLCPINCNYIGIDRRTLSSICQCNLDYLEIIEHNDYISFNFNEKDFYNSYKDIYFSMNTLKCLKLSFTSKGAKNNYGFFIIIILAIAILICFGLMIKYGKKHLIEVFEALCDFNLNKKPVKPVKNKLETEIYSKGTEKDNINDIIKEGRKSNYLNININKQKIKSNEIINQPKENKQIDFMENENKKVKEREENIIYNSPVDIRIKQSEKNDINYTEYKHQNQKELIEIFFTEQEMNSMNLEQSKKYDTRNLIEIYFSFLNMKQPLFFLFNYYPKKEEKKHRVKFNSLKIIIFCYEIMIYMFIYSSFFGSKSVSKIYFRNFNFGEKFVMGIIIAPFAMIIKSVVYYFIYGLINKKIVEIKITIFDKMKRNGLKSEEDLTKEYEILIDKIIKYFKKKLYIILGITIIILFLIWCFVSSFCAVYKNSQNEFLISILVCYFFSNIFSFFYCYIPSWLRKYAIENKSKIHFTIAEITKII